MAEPFNDDEKRYLLAEIIKASQTDVVLLADFVRANCVGYSWFSVQPPLGRSIGQCIEAVEGVLNAPAHPQGLKHRAPSWSWQGALSPHEMEIAESDSGYGGSTLAYSPAPSSIGEPPVHIQPRPSADNTPTPGLRTYASWEIPAKKRRGRPPRRSNLWDSQRPLHPLAPVMPLAPHPAEHQQAPWKGSPIPASYVASAPSGSTDSSKALGAESAVPSDQLHDYKGATPPPDTTEKFKGSHSPTGPREDPPELLRFHEQEPLVAILKGLPSLIVTNRGDGLVTISARKSAVPTTSTGVDDRESTRKSTLATVSESPGPTPSMDVSSPSKHEDPEEERVDMARPREEHPREPSPSQLRETPTTTSSKSHQLSSELQPGARRPSDGAEEPSIGGEAHSPTLPTIEPSPPPEKTPTAQDANQEGSLDQDVSKQRSPSPLRGETSSNSSSTSESTAEFPTHYGDNGSTTDEVCDLVLSVVFETSLDGLDASQDAWRSVHRCLSELSTIVNHQEFHISQNGAPHQSVGEPSSSSAGTPGSGSRKRKRVGGRASEGSGSGNDDAEGDGRGSANGSSPRKKRSKNVGGLSCPYRKRNPLRFNVRSHDNCSLQGYRDITLLKRHILWAHKRPLQIPRVMCSRCREGFATQADVDVHLRVRDLRDMCALVEPGVPAPGADLEDGISPAVDQRLRNRAASQQVLDWPTLWRALFPDDTVVPDSAFNPVVELDEVEVTFHRKAPAFRLVIHDRLLCATAGAPQLVWVTESLVDAMCDAFKELFAQTIEESRATFGGLGALTNRESSRGDEGTRSVANDDAASHKGSSEASQGGLIPKLLPRPTSTPHSDSTYGSLVPMAETAILNNVGMELSTTETVTYNNVSLEDESTGESGSSHNARPEENPVGPDYCLGCSEPGIQCVCATIWNFNPDVSKDFGSGNPD